MHYVIKREDGESAEECAARIQAEIEKRTGFSAQFVRLLRPGLALVARYLFGLDFDTISPEHAVPDIAPRPILFIHGRNDAVIPVENAYRLKAASRNPVDELWIHPLGHTEGVRLQGKLCETLEPSPLREQYLRKVTAFFSRTLLSPRKIGVTAIPAKRAEAGG